MVYPTYKSPINTPNINNNSNCSIIWDIFLFPTNNIVVNINPIRNNATTGKILI